MAYVSASHVALTPMGPGVYPGLGDLPAPIQWIKDRLGEFFALPARIAAAREKARRLEAVAAAKGNTTALQQLRDARGALERTAADQTGLADRVRWIIEQLGRVGIQLGGVIPLVVIAVGGAVALGIAALFASVKKQENVIQAVADGILTPQEAADFERAGQRPLFDVDLSKLLLPAALITGAVFFGPRLLRQARARG